MPIAADDEYWGRPFPTRNLFDPQKCAERRVRIWLSMYPQLAEACYLGCSLDASPSTSGSASSITSMGSAELICIKADVDVAMGMLPPRWRIVFALYYEEGLLQREVGNLMMCNRQRVSTILRQGVARMAAQLVYKNDDGTRGEAGLAGGV